MIYQIIIADDALLDIEEVIDYIENHLLAPIAATNFSRGIYAQIADLKTTANIYAVSTYRDVLRYGDNARHIIYKGFAIIFTIHSRYVLIHRIMHGSLIVE